MQLDLLDTTASVDTPERVRFSYRLAGPGPRAVAWTLDLLLRVAVVAMVVMALAPMFTLPELSGLSTGVLLLVLFVMDWLYGALFETVLHGRTPGKLALSLRVVRHDGAPGRFPDFLLRNLLRAVDFLPVGFGVGIVAMALDGRMRRLGDLVAGTVVVVEGHTRVLGEVGIDPPVDDEERQALPPRVELTGEEIALIEAFLRRRRKLTTARAEELAWLLGPALSEATGVQAPTWERVLALAYARATGKDRTS